MTAFLDEAQAEDNLVAALGQLGYAPVDGPNIAPDGEAPERERYSDVVLQGRLRAALAQLNPNVPEESRDDALRCVVQAESPKLCERNRAFHRQLIEGVPVEYQAADGRIVHETLALLDWADPAANEWLAVTQLTVAEGNCRRRPDVVLFANGLPLVVIELKNPADPQATLYDAYNQLQTYQSEIPSLFAFNELAVVANGIGAKAGTLTAPWSRFLPWRTLDGETVAPEGCSQLDSLVEGMLSPSQLLDLIRNFVVFEDDGEVKKVAAYHQYCAVNKAVASTVQACGPAPATGDSRRRRSRAAPQDAARAAEPAAVYDIRQKRSGDRSGDGRAGVVWHTQGSGKSLSMVFYAGKIVRHPAMGNPTLVVITDRNDLDNQLYATFAACEELLRQAPVQAQSQQHLRELLNVASGGVVFTTVQKFRPDGTGQSFPQLSDRANIVVMADEAHRSQYGFVEGFARHMRDALPNATWIGFTGTPIEANDRNTPAVFGNYIDIYDIERAVQDGATVPVYYEARLARIELDESEKPRIDASFEQIAQAEDDTTRRQLQTRWGRVEALVGAQKRLALVADDLIAHFEQRERTMPGKAMVVGMSRRICVDLYDQLVQRRPHWHSDDDTQGALKVVMTGSASDPAHWQPHIRSKGAQRALAQRLKKPDDGLKMVIVCDMWLTGFDCEPLHTLYLDKPMQGPLMQAIARVNRVFGNKPGGLVVDYIGLADALQKALQDYTASGGQGKPTLDREQAVALMQEKYEVVRDLFDGFDYAAIIAGPKEHRQQGVKDGADFILGLADGKQRYLQAVAELSKAFSLCVPHERALAIQDELGFFQAVRAQIVKAGNPRGSQDRQALDAAMHQLVSNAIAPEGVTELFADAGLNNPELSVLSDEFLQQVRELPQRNLAVETLQKLLENEIQTQSWSKRVEARSFAEQLEQTVAKYRDRAVEAAQTIEELIALARQCRLLAAAASGWASASAKSPFTMR